MIAVTFSDPDFRHLWGSLAVFAKLTTGFRNMIVHDRSKVAARTDNMEARLYLPVSFIVFLLVKS